MSKNEIVKALKLRLEPDVDTQTILDGQSRICNWLYNSLLATAHTLRHEFIQTQQPELATTVYSERGLRNLVPQMKEEYPFLKVVHSSVLKNSALRLSMAIQTHQKAKKNTEQRRVGWPKFRSWKASWFSLLYDEPNKGFKIRGDQLTLSLGMGEDRKQRAVSMRIQDAQLLEGKSIRNLRIVRENGFFFALFTVHTILPKTKVISRVIALDPNHKNLCYGVDNHK
ncbi:MAG: RNA-guided endonuclease InsQ/TnpB family protein, partial [Rhabdochlamydiaceae bacterium]